MYKRNANCILLGQPLSTWLITMQHNNDKVIITCFALTRVSFIWLQD